MKINLRSFWRKLPSFLRWVFVTLGVAIAAGLVILAGVWAAKNIRGMIEKSIRQQLIEQLVEIEQELPTGLEKPAEELKFPVQTGTEREVGELEPLIRRKVEIHDQMVDSSFTDLFSGVGWLNQEETTAYHDFVTMGFSFPPEFEWIRIPYPAVDFLRGLENCISGKCLAIEEVQLPSAVREADLVNVTLGVLDNGWLVGTVEQREGQFLGRVFRYDGQSFEDVFKGKIFYSKYEGEIGFGGEADDFLAVYGAYEGKGYRIRGDEVEDISRFFGIRAMQGGFQPRVIKTNNSFYVYSLTERKPALLKLFLDEEGEIAGAVDFTNRIFTGGVAKALFAKVERHKLEARIEYSNSRIEFRRFEDLGFSKDEKIWIWSANISNYPARVEKAQISGDFSRSGADIQFYLSNDSKKWYEVELGKDFEFPNGEGRQLFWRAGISPRGNDYHSPFFDTIRLKYQVQFL